ncbi:MAG: glycosyltransferase [Roseburia sp.]
MRMLIFSSREICYFSSNFFANQIGEAFESFGCTVDVCELAKEDDLDEKLERYLHKSYDLILDFNSLLPRMALEDGSLFLNHLEGPFYNWILDHPLFHHVALEAPIVDSHAIFLDESQQHYVKEYYPEVKEQMFLSLAATESFIPVEKEKEPAIFFSGTYGSLEDVEQTMRTVPSFLQEAVRDVLEQRIAEPNLPMEEAYRRFLWEHGEEKDKITFRNDMNAMYPVDAYVRNYFRKKTLDTLLRAGIPVKVMGHDWEKYPVPEHGKLMIEKPVVFHLTFEKIAREHILLDVAPIFHHGVHDRVFAGMANRAVVLTEENEYKRKKFADGKELVYYSLENPKDLVAKAEELVTNRAFRETVQENAYASYRREHTWEHRAQSILNHLIDNKNTKYSNKNE